MPLPDVSCSMEAWGRLGFCGRGLRSLPQSFSAMVGRIFLFLFLMVLSARAADPVEFQVGAFSFERPEGWQWVVPSSSMRKAQLLVTGAGSADVTFFHFGPGEGGGVRANVDRWFGQFLNAATGETKEMVGATPVTFVHAKGTFQSGMPGGPTTPMEGYALRGAILESARGDVFVKMTGPEAVVESADAAFGKMIRDAASR